MSFAGWIMKTAATTAPKGRKDWVAAMAGEFAALKGGRLSWALGCLMTAVGWRLQVEAVYGPVAVAAFVATDQVVRPAFSALYFGWLPDGPLTGLARLTFYGLACVPVFAACFVLGLGWPRRVVMTGVIAFGVNVLAAYMTFAFILHRPGHYVHYMDLPPVAGELAVLGYCLGGAWLGAWLGVGLRRAFAPRKIARS